MDAPIIGSGDVKEQISFARHNFDNLQSLIRFSDTKAAAIVTINIFLAASGIQIAKDAVVYFKWKYPLTSTALLVAGCVFFGSFTWIVWTVQRVLRPRGARHYRHPQNNVDLMWQDHILAHGTNARYAAAVQAATPELLLKNLTDQVFEVASISKDKMDALVSARFAIWSAVVSWIIVVVASFFLLRWK